MDCLTRMGSDELPPIITGRVVASKTEENVEYGGTRCPTISKAYLGPNLKIFPVT